MGRHIDATEEYRRKCLRPSIWTCDPEKAVNVTMSHDKQFGVRGNVKVRVSHFLHPNGYVFRGRTDAQKTFGWQIGGLRS
jgi:hypothetical protein